MCRTLGLAMLCGRSLLVRASFRRIDSSTNANVRVGIPANKLAPTLSLQRSRPSASDPIRASPPRPHGQVLTASGHDPIRVGQNVQYGMHSTNAWPVCARLVGYLQSRRAFRFDSCSPSVGPGARRAQQTTKAPLPASRSSDFRCCFRYPFEHLRRMGYPARAFGSAHALSALPTT